MADKTIVTNPPVSESGKLNPNPQGEGQSLSEKEIENRVRENLRGEYERKTAELSEKLQTYESEIEELKQQAELSRAEKERLSRLERGADTIEAELQELETNPKYRAYNEKINRTSKQSKEEAVAEATHKMSVMQAEDMIADEAEKQGIDAKELRKQINETLKGGKYGDELPHRRAKLAIRDIARSREFAEKEAALKKKEQELNGFSEDGQKQSREKTLEETKKDGDTVARAKVLGL